MNRPAAKGSKITLRQSLEQVQTSKRKRDSSYCHPDLVLPELPPQVAYLWQWYADELQTGERLTYGELAAWSKLTCKSVTAVETAALRKLSFIHHKIINAPQ